ncbi:beta-galactoside-specific lectin 3-like [Malania oleifera]|uniref:beta-galactoside-specific lectin 3-like n=1 Tax=Malania oleifera TaxID=397392 RepID=UPI0025AE511F|nr:beta-galactoside-specific lectin 3-like [Malania oleifera]
MALGVASGNSGSGTTMTMHTTIISMPPLKVGLPVNVQNLLLRALYYIIGLDDLCMQANGDIVRQGSSGERRMLTNDGTILNLKNGLVMDVNKQDPSVHEIIILSPRETLTKCGSHCSS